MVIPNDNNGEAPAGADEDSLEERPSFGHIISDSPAGIHIQAFVEAANSEGEDAQSVYEEALKELRQIPEQVVVEIARAVGSCPDEEYTLKWMLVHAAAELKHPAALHLLNQIILTPIPEELSEDPHSYSSVEDETVLRTTAVDGVAELAKQGNEQAVEGLFEFLALPSFSIKRAAVQGLKNSPKGEELQGRIAECLPKDQLFLLDLKPVQVQDMEQISDPERFLNDRGLARQIEPPPTEPGAGESSEGSPIVKEEPRSTTRTTRRRRT